MARALRHGFLDGLQIEGHDMETRIITCAVRTFAEVVAPSRAHSARDIIARPGTCIGARI
jgi:hypothetical protein